MSIPWWIIPLLGYLAYNRLKKQPQGSAGRDSPSQGMHIGSGGATGQSMAASPAAVAFSLHLLVLVNAVLYIIPLVVV